MLVVNGLNNSQLRTPNSQLPTPKSQSQIPTLEIRRIDRFRVHLGVGSWELGIVTRIKHGDRTLYLFAIT